MSTVLILAAALLFGMVALLLVPLDLSLEIARQRETTVSLGFGWPFLQMRRRLEAGPRKPRSDTSQRPGLPVPARTLSAIARVPGKVAVLRSLARRVRMSFRVRGIHGRIRLGTGDPADTGRLWAFIGPLSAWCQGRPAIDVVVEPDFENADLEGTLTGSVRVYPARLAYGLGRTALSPTTLRIVFAVVASRPWER